jgi:hypothetical protein
MADKDSVQIKKQLSEKLPEYKFSVTRNDFAGGHSVNVRVLSGPFDVFANDNARDRQNGYIEIWRDAYKEDERINNAIKPDIDKMYKIIYDIGQFPSGYHGGPYLHWNFGSYSKPYEVTASKKSTPSPQKSSGQTNADSELLMSFSQGWNLYKTTINKTGTDGNPLTLVVYNLGKTKELKNIPYDKFTEFKGEMLTNLGMKWVNGFAKFEKWTFPPDTDVLKVIVDKYYGVGEKTPESSDTEQNDELPFKVGDLYKYVGFPDTIYSINSINNGMVYGGFSNIVNKRSGANPPMDIQALKNKFLYGQAVKFYGVGEKEEETPTPQPTPKSSKMSVKEIADRLMTLDSTLWDRLKIESGSQLYADDDLQKKYIKYWIEYYQGDTSIPTKMKELSMKERNELGDYFEDDNYHSLKNLFMLYGYFGMDNKVSAEQLYAKSGYGLNPKNFKPKEEKLSFKVGDEFLGKFDKNIYSINIIDESNDDVGFGIFKAKGEEISSNVLKISIIEDYIKKGYWIKIVDEEKQEGGTEEDIKKAIAALEILAEDGDEDAKKGIEALKILLN